MTSRFLTMLALGLLGGSLIACGDDDDAGDPEGPGGQGGQTAGSSGGGGKSGGSGQSGAGQGGAAGKGGQAGAGAAGAGAAGAGQGGAGTAGAAGQAPGGQAGHGLTARPANPTCLAPARPATDATLALEAFPSKDLKFTGPVLLLQAPGNATRFYVVEKTGRVKTFEGPTATTSATALDLSKVVEAGPNEAGLLGMAFHPKFADNGQVFLSYNVREGGKLLSVVARYTSADGGKTIDPGTAKVLLEFEQPYDNHNGGMIAFGPDGRLYAGFGDGGSGGDPQGNGQKLTTLLGKMLRIDVDKEEGGKPYAIPSDNPFAKGGGEPEIFAYGLRNPWRWSFDRDTGDLWAADVGQNLYEEVDVIKLGGNYGWNTMEGFHCYGAQDCDKTGLELPLIEYGHSVGQSVTGGYVYRGKALPALVGRYLYADQVSGRMWASKTDPVTAEITGELMIETGLNPSSFGEGADGELYLVNYGGSLHKIVAKAAPGPDTFPKKLSETGCVDPADPTKPAAGLIPYGVNAPFWSDGADKSRWLAIPDGTTITVDAATGDFDLPNGSVVVKEFTLGGKRIETRLMVRHDDGAWAGYSYEWNDAGTDATYVPGGKKKVIGGQTWLYPSSAQCLQCHTQAAGRTLGLEVLQLNGLFDYPGGAYANQLATLEHIGLLSSPLPSPPEELLALPDPQGSDSLEERAKSHLHTNCSFCHRPGGTGLGNADYRFTTPLASMGVCDAVPQSGDLGVAGARVISPGDPSRSVLSLRVHALDSKRMPPLGSSVVDQQGVTLLDSYISSLQECP